MLVVRGHDLVPPRGPTVLLSGDHVYVFTRPEEKALVKQVPGSLEQVLDALEADHQWLLEGGVFTQDVIDTWIEYKRLRELDQVRLRPHPHEFSMYFDI